MHGQAHSLAVPGKNDHSHKSIARSGDDPFIPGFLLLFYKKITTSLSKGLFFNHSPTCTAAVYADSMI